MGIDVLCGMVAIAMLRGQVRSTLVCCESTTAMFGEEANVAFLSGEASSDAVCGKVIIAAMRGKAGCVSMAMVEEQGSTATVCGKVNFGAFRGKVAIALLRGRV